MTNPERDAYIERLSKGGVSPQRRAVLRALQQTDEHLDGMIERGCPKHGIELCRSLTHASMLALADMVDDDEHVAHIIADFDVAISTALASVVSTLACRSGMPHERFAELFLGTVMDRTMKKVEGGPNVVERVRK